jgi:DNA modification methylase
MQLIHGDCLIEMANIPNHSVDLILCDLPYGTTACKWDAVIPFEPLWEHYWRVLKPNGAVVLFGSEPFSSYLRMSQINHFKYDWIWDKVQPSGFFNVKTMPMKLHEIISVFSKNTNTYNRQMTEKTKVNIRLNMAVNMANQKNKNVGEAFGSSSKRAVAQDYDPTKTNPMSIIRFTKRPTLKSEKFHPTQKPVALLEYLIRTYSNENETVLDNCMGSGSTGVACINTNRNFIGIEKDDKYFEIAKNRINTVLAGPLNWS